MTSRFFLPPAIALCALVWPCAQASPPPVGPAIEHVNVTVFFDQLTLGPGESKTWFWDNVPTAADALHPIVRYFNAVPIGTGAPDNPWVDNDQSVEVTDIYYILKGENHARDGSGGQRTYQINVTVKNLDTEHPVTFKIYQAEFK